MVTIKLSGQAAAVLIGQDPISFVTTLQEAVDVTFEGITGDKHAGITRPSDGRTPQYPRGTKIRNDRQVSIISVEEMAAVAAELGVPALKPEWLGANLLVSGIPNFTLLPPSTRLYFEHGVVLVVTALNRPCKGPGKLIQEQFPEQADLSNRFIQSAAKRRGIVAVVEHPGSISIGESFRVEIPKLDQYPG